MSGHDENFQELFLQSIDLEKCAKFDEALVALNKSSMAAAGNVADLSKVFLKKSQIYHKLGHYQNCLNCLDEAKKLGTDDDKVKVLMENCRSLLELNGKSENVFKNIFKLSYPHHPKIPFIVDCLELKEDEKYGKYIITNQDLKAGDVIAIEKSHFHFVSSNAVTKRCYNCLRSNRSDLKSYDTPGHHEIMCKILQNLLFIL